MKVSFTVPGQPMGKQRPRFGNGFTYTPQKTVNYENWVKQCYLSSNAEKHLEGEICAKLLVFYEIPKSTSKKNRSLMCAGAIRPTKKPDCDNVAKIILDSLNNIAYHDDSQVVELHIEKIYSEEPRVEVTLSETED